MSDLDSVGRSHAELTRRAFDKLEPPQLDLSVRSGQPPTRRVLVAAVAGVAVIALMLPVLLLGGPAEPLDTTPRVPTSPPIVTTDLPSTSLYEPAIPGSYPVDDHGRRLVPVAAGSLTYACGPIIFPQGNPPEVVAGPTVDVETLLASAGPPGVDQNNFYEVYHWAVVVDTGTWISLLGYPRFESQPNLYGGSHAYIEFALHEQRWLDVGSDWCDAVARPAELPTGAGSVSLALPEEYRQAVIAIATGEQTEDARETLTAIASSEEWRNLFGTSSPAEWRLDPDLRPDPGSSLLPIQIQEQACASGQPPADREIVVIAEPHGDELVLIVFIKPVPGVARCPGNPWYPITVQLGAPLGDQPLYDGWMLPPQPRN